MKLLFQGEHTLKRQVASTPLQQHQLLKTAQTMAMMSHGSDPVMMEAAKSFVTLASHEDHRSTPSLTSLYTPVTVTCIVCCKNRLNRSDPMEQKTSICHGCRLDIERYRTVARTNVQESLKDYNQVWAICKQCRGRAETDLCVNSECSIFFKRHNMTRRLLVAKDKLLSLSW